MNYTNAIKLYGELVERVFSGSLIDVPKLAANVIHLRQSLSCYVCYNLLRRPCSVKGSKCQHYVCYDCRHGKLRLPTKKSCGWCRDAAAFDEDFQLKYMVDCYVQLCQDSDAKECFLLAFKMDDSETARKAEMYVKEGAALETPTEITEEDLQEFKKPSAASLTKIRR